MRARSGRRRIGILTLASPTWQAGHVVTEVMMNALVRAHDPAREELFLIAPNGAPAAKDGVTFLEVPATDRSIPALARRFALALRDRSASLPGEWSLRRPLRLSDPSNALHVARMADMDVVLPVTGTATPGVDLRRVGWIPDFQHRYLPELFSAQELVDRDATHAGLAESCVRMIFSSRAAQADFARFHPEHAHKARVASFPSQLVYQRPSDPVPEVAAKYGLPAKFALVVNQFWAHKNHQVVIDAAAALRARGSSIPIVLAGALVDYRDPQGLYLSSLLQKMSRARPAPEIHVLGRVPFGDLLGLLRTAAVVVQPSRFEGWNTTVQDALTLGRPLLCSDLEVHREQARGDVGFFGCDRPEELADLLAARWETYAPGPDAEREARGLADEERLAARYGEALLETSREAML